MTTPDDNSLKTKIPDDSTPDDNTPDDNTTDDNTPDDNTPDDNTPDDNTLDENIRQSHLSWKWRSGEGLLWSIFTTLEQIALQEILQLEEIQSKSPSEQMPF
jgi:hypothetical protein